MSFGMPLLVGLVGVIMLALVLNVLEKGLRVSWHVWREHTAFGVAAGSATAT